MRKPAFCICENKDADQLRGNCEADQCLCFRYTDSTIPLLPKSEISSLQPSSVAVQPGLCRTWSETPKTGFLIMRLIFKSLITRKPIFGVSAMVRYNQFCSVIRLFYYILLPNNEPLLYFSVQLFHEYF